MPPFRVQKTFQSSQPGDKNIEKFKSFVVMVDSDDLDKSKRAVSISYKAPTTMHKNQIGFMEYQHIDDQLSRAQLQGTDGWVVC
jgi:hypothetical protein